MVSRNRMQNLYRLLRRVERDRIPGDAVEAGVARGGTAILIATTALRSPLDRQVWLYDAFELRGDYAANYDEVRRTFFETFRFDPKRVHLVRGLFEDTVSQFPNRRISFLHIDAAPYEGVKTCLEVLFRHLSPGGWIAFDNYGSQPGCRRAVDEHLAAHGLSGRLRRFSHAQAYVQKP